jgi:hypothetical protein
VDGENCDLSVCCRHGGSVIVAAYDHYMIRYLSNVIAMIEYDLLCSRVEASISSSFCSFLFRHCMIFSASAHEVQSKGWMSLLGNASHSLENIGPEL